MPLQSDLAEFCVDLKIAPGLFCVTLPGGAEICVQADANVPDAADAARKLFEQANAALTPLVPIFNIIDIVIAIVNCVKTIPDIFSSVPPDPRELIACVPDLLKKLNALLALLPATSIPLLAAQILDALIAFVAAYKQKLIIMRRRLDAVIRAQTRAAQAGNVQLQILMDCAEANISAELVNLNAGFTPIQRLIGIVNAFLDLAELPCIPPITGVPLDDESIAGLDLVIDLLQTLRDAIPIPTIDPLAPASFNKVCDT